MRSLRVQRETRAVGCSYALVTNLQALATVNQLSADDETDDIDENRMEGLMDKGIDLRHQLVYAVPHQSSVTVHVGEGAEKISAYRTRRVSPTEYRAGNSRPKSVGKITYNVK